MRRLIYVPLIHTMADMGSVAETLRRESVTRFGAERWEGSRQVIEEMWDGIRVKVLALRLPWEQVRIYQDGLPVSDKELTIAREVAALGSKNYELVMELVGKGATLMGTESPELLEREYDHIKRIGEAKTDAERQDAELRYAAESAEILRARDAFVAQRIADTLQEGEVGVLFVGLMHEVERLLPEGIQLSFLFDRLPLREA